MGIFNEKACTAACLNGKWGVIDVHNNVHVPFIYDRAYNPGYKNAIGMVRNSLSVIFKHSAAEPIME